MGGKKKKKKNLLEEGSDRIIRGGEAEGPVDSNRLWSGGLQAERAWRLSIVSCCGGGGGGGFAFNKSECFERIFSRKFLVNGNLPFLHCSSSCLPLPLFGVIARMGRGVPEFREKLEGRGRALRRLEEVSKGA